METELQSVTLRAAVLVAGMHAKIFDRTPTMGLYLCRSSGMVRLETKTGDYFIAAAYVESCQCPWEVKSGVVHEPLPPPPNELAPDNREMFERIRRDEKDRVEAPEPIDAEIAALLDPEPKKRSKKK